MLKPNRNFIPLPSPYIPHPCQVIWRVGGYRSAEKGGCFLVVPVFSVVLVFPRGCFILEEGLQELVIILTLLVFVVLVVSSVQQTGTSKQRSMLDGFCCG